jgi:hypothetical protein
LEELPCVVEGATIQFVFAEANEHPLISQSESIGDVTSVGSD